MTSHDQQHPEPLAKLTIADSIFLGYVCTHRSLSAIEQFREHLMQEVHPNAAHVPFAASVENSSAVSLTAAATADENNNDNGKSNDNFNNDNNNNSELLQEGYDDDDEPTAASVGKSLLFELNRYKRLLRRQSTIKIRGSYSSSRRSRSEGKTKKEGAAAAPISQFGMFIRDAEEDEKNDTVSNNSNIHNKQYDGDNEYNEKNVEEEGGTRGTPIATAIIIVRYFQSRLLGVTNGRLHGVYARTARLALHRHLHGRNNSNTDSNNGGIGGRDGGISDCSIRYVERYTMGKNNLRNLYGLGAGDTELIVGVVPFLKDGEDDKNDNNEKENDACSRKDQREQQRVIVEKLMSELHFEGMVGSKNEPLPRLQNLQADLPIVDIFHDNHHDTSNTSTNSTNSSSNDPDNISNNKTILSDQGANIILPIYRYPGNYSGTEWPTHTWSPTTLSIKHSVEKALLPLYSQHMNHCVSNLYRDGYDRIDHHSDKDLDLNREGVIISVSLGSTRVMELRDREFPHDVARVDLPPGSMFVLGPFTNVRFTHAVLPVEGVGEDVSYHDEGGERSDYDDDDEGDDEWNGGERKEKDAANGGTNGAKCCIEGGGRISLTFRDVRTFLDVKTQRLFGQGVVSSFETPILIQDGMVTKESLSRALQRVREDERKDSNRARAVASVIGIGVGYVSSLNANIYNAGENSNATKSNGSESREGLSLLRSLSLGVISASASYWYLRYLQSEMRRRREEMDAREFFSKKSASGNKY